MRKKFKSKQRSWKTYTDNGNGTTYDLGLAETANDEDFLGKLNSLDRKWECLCPEFLQWLCSNRVDKFLESVIFSARDGTKVAGVYYQKDIELMYLVERKRTAI